MKPFIRLADQNDAAELVRLRLAYFQEEFQQIPPETEQAISRQLPAYFTSQLNQQCVAAVAEHQETHKLIACALLLIEEKPANPFFPNGKTGYILGVFTEKPYRRQGIADSMIKCLQDASAKMQLDYVSLSASKMGQSIYERNGFQIKHSEYTEMEWMPL
ncbi:MAG: GNAT family N-acetyltransferase [Oscillospiraceae bacterium]|nr:GNAT family N-acetyltransferase [Oscillospiraceae bacterium]